MGKVRTEFTREDSWDGGVYYRIFEREGEKYIKLLYYADRIDRCKGYLNFEYAILEDKPEFEKKLSEFDEWNPSKTFSEMMHDAKGWLKEGNPQLIFNLSNKYIKGDGEGCRWEVPFTDCEIDIPCGYYYY